MVINNKEKVVAHLKMIREGHGIYITSSHADRLRIISGLETVFKELTELGLPSSFGYLYLLYGALFLQNEFNVLSLDKFIDTKLDSILKVNPQ